MISSPHSFRNLFSIIILVLVLASMIIFYVVRRKSLNQNLLIASVPVHYFIDDYHATSYTSDWRWIYNREFKDTLNFVAAKKVYSTDDALLTFMAQIDKSYINPSRDKVMEHELSPVQYQLSTVTLSESEIRQWTTLTSNYCNALEALCNRPYIFYWSTQYGGRHLPADTLHIDFNPVLQRLEDVRDFTPKNGVVTLHGKMYELDHISPNDLSILIDYWLSIHLELNQSYSEIFAHGCDIIRKNYKSIVYKP